MQINRKLLQIFIHIVAWLLFISMPLLIFGKLEEEVIPIKAYYFLFRLFLFVSLFYLNYLVFIPRLLSKRKFILFAASLIVSIGVVITLNYLTIKYSLADEAFNHIDNSRKIAGIGFVSVFLAAIGTSIKITQKWYNNEKQKNIINNEKLNSELSFLRSQVNPHFLFNTLNNIYSLANRKSEQTGNAIMKLSHLMRYMLYEAKKDRVDLQNEINYLTDYIELQKLRMPDKSKVVFNIEGNENDKEIEPMLLVPFLENAFKHGDIYSDDAKIDILLRIKETELLYKVENKIDEATITGKDKVKGIGLDNLNKRLKLYYPGKHEFSTEKKGNVFISILKIRFD
ncbi:MAG: histidine kinase [Bacteroidales bacterium]|nr:histidine kinase [Bacteroidales bacterium]